MIVYLTQGARQLALRLRETGSFNPVTRWEDIQLLIAPGQYDNQCGPNGSPWFLSGCWYNAPTGVDVANYRPDFPTIVYCAADLDEENRIVFHLDERLDNLPAGRYSGTLRQAPMKGLVFEPMSLRVGPKQPDRGIPLMYHPEMACDVKFPDGPVKFEPPQHCCVLAQFDIDLGPACVDHMIDQISVEMAMCPFGDK